MTFLRPPALLSDQFVEFMEPQLGSLVKFLHLLLQGFALLHETLRYTFHFLVEYLNLALVEIFFLSVKQIKEENSESKKIRSLSMNALIFLFHTTSQENNKQVHQTEKSN
jgi:hypothetical protein